MAKPEASVVADRLSSVEDHLHAVELARAQLARSARRIVAEFKQWEEALRTIDHHGENALACVDEIRQLRPTIRGRRTDLTPPEPVAA